MTHTVTPEGAAMRMTCYFCGMIHASPTCVLTNPAAICWRIKEIEYHPDGSIKRVVTHSPEGEANYTPGYVPKSQGEP